ncbi:MAG: A/G-specific adenine glycosylase [Candidatus Caldarchaeum sp.]
MTPTQRTRLRKALLLWYRSHARALPWREQPTAYRVWISEVMLQQTPVKIAIPYFLRFVKRFPNPRALAEASLDEVLTMWAGLGYYRRAKMLHQTAQHLVSPIPKHWEEWQKLPGIGRYTARAITSIAFGERVSAIDANAKRVLTRIYFQKEKPTKPPKELEALSESLMGDAPPGLWNQAIMELGSLVCLPNGPKCEECPIGRWCGFFRCGKPSETLTPKPRKHYVVETHLCLCSLTQEGVGLRRAGKGEWWEGMYVFPRVTVPKGERLEASVRSLHLGNVTPLEKIFHSIMNYRITLFPVITSQCLNGVHYFPLQEASALPLPSPDRRVLQQILLRK